MYDADRPEQFNNLLQEADLSFVVFGSMWSGPYKSISPYIVEQCQSKGVNLIKVDVDKNGSTAQKYDVMALPAFKVIDRNGNVVFEKVGGSKSAVDACVSRALEG